MNLNDIFIVGGVAVFLLPVVYLMGYARREQQHGKTVEACKKNVLFQRLTLTTVHDAEKLAANNHIRELEISLLQAGEAIEKEVQNHAVTERNRVKSDYYRQAIVKMMFDRNLWNFAKHYDVPATMLQLLLEDAAKHAVDPAVSQKAKNLHTRGVRKGAKMGREQMRKLMQKSIDNQAATIRHYDECVKESEKMRITYRTAVHNVLEDKVALPGVRKSLRHAISEEITRLRRVDALKGE